MRRPKSMPCPVECGSAENRRPTATLTVPKFRVRDAETQHRQVGVVLINTRRPCRTSTAHTRTLFDFVCPHTHISRNSIASSSGSRALFENHATTPTLSSSKAKASCQCVRPAGSCMPPSAPLLTSFPQHPFPLIIAPAACTSLQPFSVFLQHFHTFVSARALLNG